MNEQPETGTPVIDGSIYKGMDPQTRTAYDNYFLSAVAQTQLSPVADGLTEVEGYEEAPYIPIGNDGEVMGNSGITFGNGLDAGQASPADWLKMGLDPSFVNKVDKMGLFGKTKKAAVRQLVRMQTQYGNLPFSAGEVAYASNTFVDASADKISARMPAGRWDNMNASEQKVVMSLQHLYGDAFFGHNGFQQAVDGDWNALYTNMDNYAQPMHNSRHRTMREYLIPSMSLQDQLAFSGPDDLPNQAQTLLHLNAPIELEAPEELLT